LAGSHSVSPEGRHLKQTSASLRTGVLEDAREIAENWIDRNGDEMLRRFGLDPGAATDVIPRPHRLSNRELAEVAQAYVDALERGIHPRQAVAEWRQCSLDYASKLIRLARERGLLTGGERKGRAGGELTERCRKVLEAA
jgi:hypothetical protein